MGLRCVRFFVSLLHKSDHVALQKLRAQYGVGVRAFLSATVLVNAQWTRGERTVCSLILSSMGSKKASVLVH